jgi:hypothetical protein
LLKSGQQFRPAMPAALRPKADLNMCCVCFQCVAVKIQSRSIISSIEAPGMNLSFTCTTGE